MPASAQAREMNPSTGARVKPVFHLPIFSREAAYFADVHGHLNLWLVAESKKSARFHRRSERGSRSYLLERKREFEWILLFDGEKRR